MNSRFLLPISVMASALSGIAIISLVSFLLPAEEFSRFSLCFTWSLLVSAICFEPIRLFVLRLGSTRHLQNPFHFLSPAFFAGFALASILSSIFVYYLNFPAIYIFVIMFFSLNYSRFEILQAYFRVQEKNKDFLFKSVFRSFLSVLFALAASFASDSAALVVSAIGLSYFLGSIRLSGQHFPLLSSDAYKSGLGNIKAIASFGLPLAVASISANAVPAILKQIIVNSLSADAAAGWMLAFDYCMRTFGAVGMAANLVLFTKFSKMFDQGLQKSACSKHLAITTAVFIGLLVLAFTLEPLARSFLIPLNLIEGYSSFIYRAIVLSFLLNLIAFGLNSSLAISKRVRMSFVPSLIVVLSFLILLFIQTFFKDIDLILLAALFPIFFSLFVAVILNLNMYNTIFIHIYSLSIIFLFFVFSYIFIYF